LSAGGKRGWLMFWIFVPVNLGRGFVWGSVHGLTLWVWVMRSPGLEGGVDVCTSIFRLYDLSWALYVIVAFPDPVCGFGDFFTCL
jgi:hypothetical protein